MSLQFDLFGTRKTLFGRQALRQALQRSPALTLSGSALEYLKRWQGILRDQTRRSSLTEPQHAQSFLRDLFERVLGYPTTGAADRYSLSFENPGPADTRPADAVLGFFGEARNDRVRVVIEAKRPGTDLDARSGRADRLSAVDQGFLYASNFDDVRWVIITNFDEVRLYSHRRGKLVFEPFAIATLEGERLRDFMFLLTRSNLLGDGENIAPTEALAENVWTEQAEISRRFYAEYQEARLELFEDLRKQNSDFDGLVVLSATQTLLDRLLFIMFCSDRALLPSDAIRQVREYSRPDRFTWRPDALWSSLGNLFRAVDAGDPLAQITGYNGGLFSESPLDRMQLNEEQRNGRFVLRRILQWDDYDFESQIDVDVLGHIFENSISDLERLEREIRADPRATRLHWRNRQGIFYTPEWVTTYIIRHTAEVFLDEHPEVGSDFMILDPACGSGAFLTQLVPLFLTRIRQLAPEEAARAEAAFYASDAQMGIFEDPGLLGGEALYAAIRRSVYGVDKSSESVEITKLSFWLKTAIRGRPLPTLDETIQTGNSLVAEAEAVEDAFVWNQRIPRLNSGGPHVIVGNPPWGADKSEYAAHLHSFSATEKQSDTAFLFVELALQLLTDGGVLGFVVPDSILINEDLTDLRYLLLKETTLLQVIKLGEGVFPGVYRGSVILILRKGTPDPEHRFRALIVTKADRREITDVSSSVDLETLMERKGVTVRQDRVLNNSKFVLDIFVGEEDEALLAKIEADPLPWNEVLMHGRGIELNSSGLAIRCPNCFRWDAPPQKRKGIYDVKTCIHCGAEYPLAESISSAHLIAPDADVLATGEAWYIDGTDVNRYRIEGRSRIDLTKDGIRYKEPVLYESPKIVFRQAGIGITATMDLDWNAYVPQSVFVFRLRPDRADKYRRYSLAYILGVLNSRVMLYYYFKKTGQVEWQSFPRWTQSRVLDLPVRLIDWSNAREVALHDGIADAVEDLVRRGGTGSPEEDLHIERMVMELYGLTSSERSRVWMTLRSVQGLKAVREVLPPVQTVLG